MKKRVIALLSGGISSEREVSINSGNQVYETLDKEKYTIRRYDPKTDLSRLVAEAGDIDFALIILHGPFGEDGTVQGMLDLLGIPYQGAGVLGSAVAMNKLTSKRLYEKAGIPTPAYIVTDARRPVTAGMVAETIGFPVVVKPAQCGSSIGLSIVRDAGALAEALKAGFRHDNTLLVEVCIDGTELTAGVIGNTGLEALPLIEIVPGEGYAFFDYNAKYLPGATTEICPARVSEEVTVRAQALAIKAHEALFLRGYSRTDMILRGEDLFVLETNTIPGMTRTSLFPQAAAKAGLSFSQMLDRLIDLGLEDERSAHRQPR
ncbi:MAG: D-alanine--D-alanine ligase [Pseudomonadota bacterium]